MSTNFKNGHKFKSNAEFNLFFNIKKLSEI